MKRPQTKFHTHTMSDFQAVRSKQSKLSLCQNLSLGQIFLPQFFSPHRYVIETSITDIDMLLQVYLKFCNTVIVGLLRLLAK